MRKNDRTHSQKYRVLLFLPLLGRPDNFQHHLGSKVPLILIPTVVVNMSYIKVLNRIQKGGTIHAAEALDSLLSASMGPINGFQFLGFDASQHRHLRHKVEFADMDTGDSFLGVCRSIHCYHCHRELLWSIEGNSHCEFGEFLPTRAVLVTFSSESLAPFSP